MEFYVRAMIKLGAAALLMLIACCAAFISLCTPFNFLSDMTR